MSDKLNFTGTRITTAHIGAGRMTAQTPTEYRLVKRGNEYVLQGAFHWQEGRSYGHDWRDLPTIQEQEHE